MEKRDPFEDMRPIQYQDVYQADDHPLIDVSKSTARWMAYFLMAVVLLLIFLGSNVKLARYVTYKFVLESTGEGDTLYASASIPPEEIGLVKEGAPAILKVATFPHYEWGAVEGRIQTLSLTPDEKGDYPIRVEITNAGKLKGRLRVGMNGDLSIPIEEKSFFGYVFEKVRKATTP
jgi:hypothetical protein